MNLVNIFSKLIGRQTLDLKKPFCSLCYFSGFLLLGEVHGY